MHERNGIAGRNVTEAEMKKKVTIVIASVAVLWVLSQTWGVSQLSTHHLRYLMPANNASAVRVRERVWLEQSQVAEEWYYRRGAAILPCFIACDVAYAKGHIGNATRHYHLWLLGLSVELSGKFIWQAR